MSELRYNLKFMVVMKAIGFTSNHSVSETGVLTQFDAPEPQLGEYDILVKVEAVSINPVDTKVQQNFPVTNPPSILGYDCAGEVMKCGASVKKFSVGDSVFYAGDITRNGTNAEFHAVDERIVGHKPTSISFKQAAALPLTSITAWEIIHDALQLDSSASGHILIIGGAGGVGSILIQLIKQLTNLTVIATASREETIFWVQKMGADIVINHRLSIAQQLADLGISPQYVVGLTQSDSHFNDIVDCISPRGHVVFIDDPKNIDITLGKKKSLSFHWEFMFTRSMFQTPDIMYQGELLDEVSRMVDEGLLQSTMNNHLGQMSVETITTAHILQSKGSTIGKNVLSGF